MLHQQCVTQHVMIYTPPDGFVPPQYPTNERVLMTGIEIDSQILNALFCVTGIGLLPWRLRDGYLLYRGDWPKLSKIHSGWYIDGVTKRSLMWWVVILFLLNSAWQIAVTPSQYTQEVTVVGCYYVVYESIRT